MSAEYELRVGDGSLAVRVEADSEAAALDAADELVGLPDGDVTVYPAADVPVGLDGVDPEVDG